MAEKKGDPGMMQGGCCVKPAAAASTPQTTQGGSGLLESMKAPVAEKKGDGARIVAVGLEKPEASRQVLTYNQVREIRKAFKKSRCGKVLEN